jgi:hypothetical protein
MMGAPLRKLIGGFGRLRFAASPKRFEPLTPHGLSHRDRCRGASPPQFDNDEFSRIIAAGIASLMHNIRFEIALRRSGSDVGDVVVHFPRVGYVIRTL